MFLGNDEAVATRQRRRTKGGPRLVRVLWVTPLPPDQRGSAIQVRHAHLLFALAGRANITIVSAGVVTDPDVRAAAFEVIEVDVAGDSPTGSWSRRAGSLARAIRGDESFDVSAHKAVRWALAPAVARRGADVVIVESLMLADIAAAAPVRKRILMLSRLESRHDQKMADISPSGRRKWLLNRNADAARQGELAAVSAADRVIVSAAADAHVLQDPRRANAIQLIPNGVDVPEAGPEPQRDEATIAAVGALGSDGGMWLGSEVLPLVLRHQPQARLQLVAPAPGPAPVSGPAVSGPSFAGAPGGMGTTGHDAASMALLEALAGADELADSNVSDALARLAAQPGVELHANVPDLVPHLRAARVVADPSRVGWGTRLSTLEAMAAGCPVVGTRVAFEGLDVVNGTHALVADDAAGFAAALGRVISDETLAKALGINARRLVEERYNWLTVGGRFADAVLSTLER